MKVKLPDSWLRWLGGQLVIVALAAAIALLLPYGAAFLSGLNRLNLSIFSPLLLLNQVILGIALAALLVGVRMLWNNRFRLAAAKRAGILNASGAFPTGLGNHELVADLPVAREVFLWSLTGCDIFARRGTLLFALLPQAHQIRVMLLNPRSDEATRSMSEAQRAEFQAEMADSIRCLESLHRAGKRVQLKFCDAPPLWQIAVVGDRVWVRYCHGAEAGSTAPEYVFALQPKEPTQGFFVPFYTYFLDHWSDFRHPEYDFDTQNLVYRDQSGAEVKRMPLNRGARVRKSERRVLRAYSEPIRLAPARVNALSRRPQR